MQQQSKDWIRSLNAVRRSLVELQQSFISSYIHSLTPIMENVLDSLAEVSDRLFIFHQDPPEYVKNNEDLEFSFIGQIVLIRTYSAGVWFGCLDRHNEKEVILSDAIRIWSWSGAASLSQLAVEGVKDSANCKFAMPVKIVLLTEVIEIIPITSIALDNLNNVKPWKV